MTRRGINIFVVILILSSAHLIWKIWNIFPLYTNTELRAQIKTSLTDVANREGWLLSDISVQAVSRGHVRLNHRIHRRGSDPESCFLLKLADNSLLPCA